MDTHYPLEDKKKKRRRSSRNILTQFDKIWSKFFVKPASVLSTGSTPFEEAPPSTKCPDRTAEVSKNRNPKIITRTRKDILFEGMGNSLVISIRTTEKCLTNGQKSAAGPPVHTEEVVKYLKWVRRNTQLHMNCFVIAFGYLYRLVHSREENGAGPSGSTSVRHHIVFTRSNWRLLVITAIMIAQKFNHDESYPNAEIVKLLEPEYTIKQLNKMEVVVLTELLWDCSFTPQEYQDYYRYIRWYATLLL